MIRRRIRGTRREAKFRWVLRYIAIVNAEGRVIANAGDRSSERETDCDHREHHQHGNQSGAVHTRASRPGGLKWLHSLDRGIFDTARPTSGMHLDADSTAVVVVDMQNGFCHEEGSLYAPPSEAVIEPIADLIGRARDAGTQIVFTRDVHPPEQFEDAHYYDEFDRWGEHVLEGSWEAEIVEGLSVRDSDHVVEKHTYDAFQETEIDGWLSARGITDLVFCGTLANVCVLHSAGSAGLRDYRPILVEDAVGYIDAEHKDYALEHADWLFGEVVSREDLTFA